MIAFINGPFGVGKTTTAKLLVERLPDAMLYDPEVVGYLLRSVLSPIEERCDFQDYSLWPKMVVEFAGHLKDEYGRDLVVPMTIMDRSRFEYIVSGFKEIDENLHTFRLTVSETELRRRITSDLEDEQARPWRTAYIEAGLGISKDPAFGTEIKTDRRMPEEVAAETMASVGLGQRKFQRTASSAK